MREECWNSLPEILIITDKFDPDNPSITNAAEHMLIRIQRETVLPRSIIYRHTEGMWGRLKVNGLGRFIGFSPIAPGLDEKLSELDMGP